MTTVIPDAVPALPAASTARTTQLQVPFTGARSSRPVHPPPDGDIALEPAGPGPLQLSVTELIGDASCTPAATRGIVLHGHASGPGARMIDTAGATRSRGGAVVVVVGGGGGCGGSVVVVVAIVGATNTTVVGVVGGGGAVVVVVGGSGGWAVAIVVDVVVVDDEVVDVDVDEGGRGRRRRRGRRRGRERWGDLGHAGRRGRGLGRFREHDGRILRSGDAIGAVAAAEHEDEPGDEEGDQRGGGAEQQGRAPGPGGQRRREPVLGVEAVRQDGHRDHGVRRGAGRCRRHAGGRAQRTDGGEHVLAEVGRRGDCGRHRQERHGRVPPLALGARRALVHVPGDALADEHAERAVPVAQDRLEVRAVAPSGPGHHERAETALDALAHAVHDHVALFDADAERGGEVGAGEALAGGHLQHELVAGVEPARRLPEVGGELGGLDRAGLGPGILGRDHLRRPRGREVGRALPRASVRAPVDLVAQDREQPRLEARRIASWPIRSAAITNTSWVTSAAS